ncbi:MAG: 6-pyruvoyl-tetrahydropterin synthase-related protein [Deltaproteobacteria bacterium]
MNNGSDSPGPGMEEFNELQRQFEELSAAHDALLGYLSRKDPSFAKGIRSVGEDHVLDGKDNDSVMAMKVVAFLNARHYMVFAGNKGKTHGHSWQLQAEADVHIAGESFVKFEDVDKHINILLAPYQRTVLNDVPPFTEVEPLTENIAVHFFNCLYDDLGAIGVDLVKLTVWENPTKGIEITSKIPNFFSSDSSSPVPAANLSVVKGLASDEVAASQEDEAPSVYSPQLQADLEQESNSIEMDEENDNILTLESAVTEMNGFSNDDVTQLELKDPEDAFENEPEDEPVNMNADKRTRKTGFFHISQPPNHEDHNYCWWQILLSILIITGVAIWAYWPVLSAPPSLSYPYGSDAWCHLLKAQFLSQEILKGNWYPQYFPYWHNGVEPFRYWAPLSYLCIALLNLVTNNIFVAANYYLFICALFGGISWLIFRKRIGLIAALFGGIIWVLWIDNLSVSFLSGNYPRVFTVMILPLLVEYFLRILDRKLTLSSIIMTILLIHIVVLCHAMMAAVFCVSLMISAIFLVLWSDISLRRLFIAGGSLILGLLTSVWWLLPSLTGGGSGFSEEATAGAVYFVPITTAFNPSLRLSDYYGLSLLILIAVFIFTWRHRPNWAKSLFITAVIMLVISLPQLSPIQSILPLHNLLWPIRFSTFWSLVLILSALAFNKESIPLFGFKRFIPKPIIVSIIVVVLLFDSFFSLKALVHSTEAPNNLQPITESIKQHSGWRVATLDLSSLGSSPSYYLSSDANREQVFGWAWQGAKTAQNVMLLNTAIENQWYPYLFQRLNYLGATDLMVLQSLIKSNQEFEVAAKNAGFSKVLSQDGIAYWHGLDTRYLVIPRTEGLAIGKYASIYSLQFPGIEIGKSFSIDDYKINDLKKFRFLILTGAQFSLRDKAEKLIVDYATLGGKVVIDLTGFPNDVAARQPKFLGVYGEPITLGNSLQIYSGQDVISLEPFANDGWKCVAPQPLDSTMISFSHYGNNAALLGTKKVGKANIYFLGGNLAYHSFLTHDPAAKKILTKLLGTTQNYQQPGLIPLNNVRQIKNGWSVSYECRDKKVAALLPFAALDGIKVKIDGHNRPFHCYENLIAIDLPGGHHSVEIILTKAPIYIWASYFSFILVLIILVVSCRLQYKNRISRVSAAS